MPPILLLLSLVGLCSSVDVLPPRHVSLPRSPPLESRAPSSFDLGWQVQDQPLFSANWSGGTGYIPLGATPFETSLAESFSLVLECLDCRTYGAIEAAFNEDDDNNNLVNATLTFRHVGAYLDFGVFSSSDGTYTIGLGRFVGKNNQTGKFFTADIGFGIDLVLQFSGEVQASGGFQLAIPDGEQVGLDIDLGMDVDALDPELNVSAGISLFPHVDFTLLPVQLSHAAANITAALVLKAEAGISADLGGVSADASVGAHLSLVQVTLGAALDSGSCDSPLSIGVESNGGAFAEANAAVVGQDLLNVGPDVSTVFASAGATTCLGASSPAFSSTRPLPPQTASNIASCPTDLATTSHNTTKTYALTSCVVPAVNCPVSLTQVVHVTNVEEATTVFCPKATALPPAVLAPSSPAQVTAVPFPASGASVSLSALASVTAAPPASYANVSAPLNATVPGVFETISVPPPKHKNGGPGGNQKLSTGLRPGIDINSPVVMFVAALWVAVAGHDICRPVLP